MALTYTPEANFALNCPDFSLPSVDGKQHSRDDYKDRAVLVVMFICNHCPYVKAIEDRLIALGRKFSPKDVGILAICSNDPSEYEEDSFENLKKRWHEKNYPFPYLHDKSQAVAKAFDAVCTPDFFVYDKNRKLAYRGRLDDSWKDASKVRREDLSNAIQSLLDGKAANEEQYPSMGCSIKWIGTHA